MSKYRFPIRSGNSFELLIDGAAFFPRMLSAIERARRWVLLEIYLFESGRNANRFIEALGAAAARGVQVNVLIDGWGARGLTGADRERLEGRGVHVAFHNELHYRKWLRNLLRDHRKILLVDDRFGYVGGAGITDEFDAATSAQSWHDIMVEIRGPVLADWHSLFVEEWNRFASRPLAAGAAEAADDMPGAGQAGRVVAAGRLRQSDLIRSVYSHMRRATQRIWFATAYFVPSRKLRRLLRRAARRGVDVRLLLPGPHTDLPSTRHAGRRFYGALLRSGVRVFEYQPRFIHAKLILCDQWVSIGSSNMDRWNLLWNLEANQEVQDPRFARQAEAMFVQDFGLSTEWTWHLWSQRSRAIRFAEWFWGSVDGWLAHLRNPRRR